MNRSNRLSTLQTWTRAARASGWPSPAGRSTGGCGPASTATSSIRPAPPAQGQQRARQAVAVAATVAAAVAVGVIGSSQRTPSGRARRCTPRRPWRTAGRGSWRARRTSPMPLIRLRLLLGGPAVRAGGLPALRAEPVGHDRDKLQLRGRAQRGAGPRGAGGGRVDGPLGGEGPGRPARKGKGRRRRRPATTTTRRRRGGRQRRGK